MKRITENGVEFVYPGLNFYESLENDVRGSTIALLRKELGDSKISPADRAATFVNARPDLVNGTHVIAYLRTAAGFRKVLDKAMEMSVTDENKRLEIINGYEPDDAMNLALFLFGFAKRIPADFLDNTDAALPNPKASTDSAAS